MEIFTGSHVGSIIVENEKFSSKIVMKKVV